MKNCWLALTAGLSSLFLSVATLAATQTVSPSPSSLSVAPGSTVEFTVVYSGYQLKAGHSVIS